MGPGERPFGGAPLPGDPETRQGECTFSAPRHLGSAPSGDAPREPRDWKRDRQVRTCPLLQVIFGSGAKSRKEVGKTDGRPFSGPGGVPPRSFPEGSLCHSSQQLVSGNGPVPFCQWLGVQRTCPLVCQSTLSSAAVGFGFGSVLGTCPLVVWNPLVEDPLVEEVAASMPSSKDLSPPPSTAKGGEEPVKSGSDPSSVSGNGPVPFCGEGGWLGGQRTCPLVCRRSFGSRWLPLRKAN